jgi:hypothetical protein
MINKTISIIYSKESFGSKKTESRCGHAYDSEYSPKDFVNLKTFSL